MVSESRRRRNNVRLAWLVFVLAVLAWTILRAMFGMGASCDFLIAAALAAQAWLFFLRVDAHK